MRVYLKTYRYGVVTTLVYHGRRTSYSEDTAVLTISEPVLDFDPERPDDGPVEAVETVVTLTNTDEYTAIRCQKTCSYHPSG